MPNRGARIQVYVNLKKTVVPVGPLVNNLGEARMVVKMLDYLAEHRALRGQLAAYSPDAEVTARRGNQSWDYHDQDPTRYSDGIWSGPSRLQKGGK